MTPSLDELRAQCRIDNELQDGLLTTYAEAAIEKAELFMNLSLYETEIPEDEDNGMLITPLIKLAIMLAVGWWYDNPDQTEPPPEFYKLLRDYRRGPGT